MGRDPWKSQQKTSSQHFVEDSFAGDTWGAGFRLRGLCGVDSKYNEQDRGNAAVTQFRLLSLQLNLTKSLLTRSIVDLRLTQKQ